MGALFNTQRVELVFNALAASPVRRLHQQRPKPEKGTGWIPATGKRYFVCTNPTRKLVWTFPVTGNW